jgi:hypothetical protein
MPVHDETRPAMASENGNLPDSMLAQVSVGIPKSSGADFWLA